MRARHLAPLLIAVLALSACGGGGGKITIGEAASGAPATTAGNDDSAATIDEATDDALTDDALTDDTMADDTTPAESSDGGVEPNMDKCIEVSEAFSSIAGSASDMTPEGAQAALDKMKEVLPSDLRDDIQTMVDVYASSPSDIGEAVSSQDFIDANNAVTDYLAQICGAG
ncbi:MAG TPA: hypothetical protein PLS46_08925 [Microthrixaceae bacterium]|nr:hypothetical protein [Microthrixaceae bacterium]